MLTCWTEGASPSHPGKGAPRAKKDQPNEQGRPESACTVSTASPHIGSTEVLLKGLGFTGTGPTFGWGPAAFRGPRFPSPLVRTIRCVNPRDTEDPMTDHEPTLYCAGCDEPLDEDGQCPSPSCDSTQYYEADETGATYTEHEPPDPARFTLEQLTAATHVWENPPDWLRDTMAEVVKAFPPVHLALARAAANVRGVSKDRSADPDQGGYRFRGIDGVLNGVHFPLAEAGILMVPRDLEIHREVWPHWGHGKWTMYRIHLEWEIYGPRGDTIIVTNWGEALDNADKGLGKARSYAQKDLLIRLLTIPTDDPDMDTEATRFEVDTPGVARGQAAPDAEPEPVDPEVVADLQYIIAGLDDDKREKVREAWKRALGPTAPEKLDGRGARKAMSLIKGMVPDWSKVLEQTKMKVEIGDLPDPTTRDEPGQDDGSEGDASPSTTAEGDTSSPAHDDTSDQAAAEPDASDTATSDDSSPGDDDDDSSEDKRARQRARADAAAAIRSWLDAIGDPTVLDQHATEVGEMVWQHVDKDLRDTFGIDPGDLHIDIRRLALVVGRAVGHEALDELVTEGHLGRYEPEPEGEPESD